MNTFLEKVGKFFLKLLARIPTQVPMGMMEFRNWSDSIIELYDFPNNDSVRFALATVIMHLGPTDAYKSRHFFAMTIKAAASKQIASGVFQDIKQRQQEAKKAAEDALKQSELEGQQNAVVTAPVATDAPQQ